MNFLKLNKHHYLFLTRCGPETGVTNLFGGIFSIYFSTNIFYTTENCKFNHFFPTSKTLGFSVRLHAVQTHKYSNQSLTQHTLSRYFFRVDSNPLSLAPSWS